MCISDRMSEKSDFLLKKALEYQLKAKAYNIDLVICGGLAIHVLSNFRKRNSPRIWNHKDIDYVVPISQFSKTIAFFKEIGFVKAFIPYKKRRLTKDHMRFVNETESQKILVDVYGLPKIPIIAVEHDEVKIALVSPSLELENWKDRRQRLGPKPAIDLSIEFLSSVLKEGSFKEKELS